MSDINWHEKTAEEVAALLHTDYDQGLNSGTARRLQGQYPNRMEQKNGISPVKILLNQFTDTMILVLLGATVISGVIGDMADAVTIMAIVIINAILGFIQEYRAEKSLEEIKKLASARALALRDGKKIQIDAEDLVPGDIVFISSGDRIPADLKLIESFSLEVDEAALTGESQPVAKNADIVLAANTQLAERENMAYMGTAATRGRAKAVVVETGDRTVMGQIAQMMQATEKEMTPLQLKLDQLGKILIVICLFVCAVVAVLGIYRGEEVITMLLAGISLAVAAIPEGLPAIVTVVLALGVQRMAKRNAIVRKLPAVETLGCTTVICTDKTGTLTQNKMTVRKIATLNQELDIDGEGYEPRGQFLNRGGKVNPCQDNAIKMMMYVAANCNNANLVKIRNQYNIQGDPTEGAILVMAIKAGINDNFTIKKENPFDSDRKMMSVLAHDGTRDLVLVKGSLDALVKCCKKIADNGNIRNINANDRVKINNKQNEWGKQALRVLAFAFKTVETKDEMSEAKMESELVLLGICGIIDPPRPGVDKSVKECMNAGVVPIMITGDHPGTAGAIAAEIGISNSNQVILGSQIDAMSDELLCKRALSARVFARVTPQHKNRIVKVLKKENHVVGMTGDGVNDAPAVKAADIGISMGITGTEVTKEASSIILADDDFSTIVRAIYEGRAIYDNIRKFIRYLLGCNIGEVLVMFFASLIGLPLPLLPIQILWVNLVTDGLPAMALGLEPPEPGIMNRKPRNKNESVFSNRLGWVILGRGLYITVVTLIAFVTGIIYCRYNGIVEMDIPRSMVLTTLVFAQLFYVFECRSERYSPFELGLFTNRFLIGAVSCSVIMQLAILYIPALQSIFNTVGLDLWQWGLILILTGARFILKYVEYRLKMLKLFKEKHF